MALTGGELRRTGCLSTMRKNMHSTHHLAHVIEKSNIECRTPLRTVADRTAQHHS